MKSTLINTGGIIRAKEPGILEYIKILAEVGMMVHNAQTRAATKGYQAPNSSTNAIAPSPPSDPPYSVMVPQSKQ